MTDLTELDGYSYTISYKVGFSQESDEEILDCSYCESSVSLYLYAPCEPEFPDPPETTLDIYITANNSAGITETLASASINTCTDTSFAFDQL